MGILRKVFEARNEWWNLVPDQSILPKGGRTEGKLLNLAARHADGKWLRVYLGDKATVSVDQSKFTGGQEASASWIDPRTGRSVPIGKAPSKGIGEVTTPDGWEDALLMLELCAAPGHDDIVEHTGCCWHGWFGPSSQPFSRSTVGAPRLSRHPGRAAPGRLQRA